MKLLHVQVDDEVCARLQRDAELSGRSLHDELVIRLGGIPVEPRPREELLAEIDAFRASLKVAPLTEDLLEQFIQEGRR